jgi:hypothetical protein
MNGLLAVQMRRNKLVALVSAVTASKPYMKEFSKGITLIDSKSNIIRSFLPEPTSGI